MVLLRCKLLLCTAKIVFNFVDLQKDDYINIVYVPSHLYHMLFELFKNSMRAVMEYHNTSDEFPPITVAVSKGKEDICLKVCFILFIYSLVRLLNYHFCKHFTDVRFGWWNSKINHRLSIQIYVFYCTATKQIWRPYRTIGRLWIWFANFTALCPIFSWWLSLIIMRGLWDWRCYLHEGMYCFIRLSSY